MRSCPAKIYVISGTPKETITVGLALSIATPMANGELRTELKPFRRLRIALGIGCRD